MMDKTILDILVCPETRTALQFAEDSLLQQINARVTEGKLLNRKGQSVTRKLGAGLLRLDERFLYPVFDDIPVMLIDEAIPLNQLKQ
ncbi:MAG: hypothetical protein HQM11_07350 [SAR324 cluster bacterium]|nr:hypothetical protein [SAR324 cluster bacterium]